MNIHLSVCIGAASTDVEIWSREICRLERERDEKVKTNSKEIVQTNL